MRIFFVHVMKTGGTSLVLAARSNVRADRIHPVPTSDLVAQASGHFGLGRLAPWPEQALDHIDFYSGHLPWAATELAGPGFSTMSVLREPVGRTLSYLKQASAMNPEHSGWPLEAVYEAEWFRKRFLDNHQTKVFSMSVAETLASPVDERPYDPTELETRVLLELAAGPLLHPLVVDDSRLAIALDNLERVDLLGVHDRYGDFLTLVERELGWKVDRRIRAWASDPVKVPESFKRQILEDNAYDVALYERAAELANRQ